jgi:hypothetical protein
MNRLLGATAIAVAFGVATSTGELLSEEYNGRFDVGAADTTQALCDALT